MSDREACIKAYLQHNAHIEASVPPEQLLVWQAKDGWEPLCRYALVLCISSKPKRLLLKLHLRYAGHRKCHAAIAMLCEACLGPGLMQGERCICMLSRIESPSELCPGTHLNKSSCSTRE